MLVDGTTLADIEDYIDEVKNRDIISKDEANELENWAAKEYNKVVSHKGGSIYQYGVWPPKVADSGLE